MVDALLIGCAMIATAAVAATALLCGWAFVLHGMAARDRAKADLLRAMGGHG